MEKNEVQVIAFYLPQFHPFKENNEWWGKGFTEWTNVGKAKPLFKGHNQPRVPTELGYYDLRLPSVREEQAKMARDAGVTAFCYWHYWFGDGRRLLSEVFNEVLETGKPDFPFCLGWANHSWFAKNWNSDGHVSERVLMEQKYPGIEDEKMHFDYLVKVFKDPRYVKIDGAPLLYIFAPQDLPNEYVANFRKWAKENGFPDIYFVAKINNLDCQQEARILNNYDAINYERLFSAVKYRQGNNFYDKIVRKGQFYNLKFKSLILNRPPFIADYSKLYNRLICEDDSKENVIPSIIPQWDHTPRSGFNGTLFVNATPDYFYRHVKDALSVIKLKKNKILFLKSWNEWGEGNMMEPDITYGRGFIEALRMALDEFED